jgi:hypothetical protein
VALQRQESRACARATADCGQGGGRLLHAGGTAAKHAQLRADCDSECDDGGVCPRARPAAEDTARAVCLVAGADSQSGRRVSAVRAKRVVCAAADFRDAVGHSSGDTRAGAAGIGTVADGDFQCAGAGALCDSAAPCGHTRRARVRVQPLLVNHSADLPCARGVRGSGLRRRLLFGAFAERCVFASGSGAVYWAAALRHESALGGCAGRCAVCAVAFYAPLLALGVFLLPASRRALRELLHEVRALRTQS